MYGKLDRDRYGRGAVLYFNKFKVTAEFRRFFY